MAKESSYVPFTPAGTACTWLASRTEAEAWDRLLEDAAHMPYITRQAFEARGYTVELVKGDGKSVRRDNGGMGGRDCGEIRTAIDILHLDTLRQMKTDNVLADRREPIGEASSPKGEGRAAG